MTLNAQRACLYANTPSPAYKRVRSIVADERSKR